MKSSKLIIGLFVVVVCYHAPLFAQGMSDAEKQEMERRDAFRTGMEEIVADLNKGSYQRFINAIDRDDMIDRIYGLRLIDQQVKKQFNQSLEYSYNDMIEAEFAAPKDGLKVKLLGIESRGDRGRAVVRIDYPKFEFNYHEYELRLNDGNRLIVVDWTDYLWGYQFSESVGQALVMSAPSKPAMRKLLDIKNVRDNELFRFGELLKASRDTKLDRYNSILEDLDPRFQKQRIVVVTSARIARRARIRRSYIAALTVLAEVFPNEPLYTLMLLDIYIPTKRYEEAMQALQGLSDTLGFPDAATEARKSAAALVMGNPQQAADLADQALELEPGLELGWWSALGARVELADFKGCVEILQKLESDFDHELGPDKFKKNRQYAQLLASPEFKGWVEAKSQN
jgi:tetratricopeptide (TPR) repeat protein